MTMDPVSAAVAPAIGLNALANATFVSMNIGKELSIAANYHSFDLRPFPEYSSPEPAVSSRFEVKVTYRRHCRVLGVRALRLRAVLQLSGSIVRYERAADTEDQVGSYGFRRVSFKAAATGGQNPFNKFNEESILTFTPEFVDDVRPRLRIHWDASAGTFAPAGVPIAMSKRRNGFFELDTSGHIVPGDPSTLDYFAFDYITMPQPGDDYVGEPGLRDKGKEREGARREVIRRSDRQAARKPGRALERGARRTTASTEQSVDSAPAGSRPHGEGESDEPARAAGGQKRSVNTAWHRSVNGPVNAAANGGRRVLKLFKKR